MFLSTTEHIEGITYQILGIVKGSTVQTKHVGKDFMAGLKTLVGGEIASYTEMMNEARDTATSRMVTEAQRLGADGIVSIRFTTSAIMQGASEVMAYGTAVKVIRN